MTKEEKEAKGKEEEEVPEGFVDAVNEFYESSDIIFKCFDDIYSDFLRGKDVREDLKSFMNVKKNVFALITDTRLREEKVKKWLETKGIEKEKSNKILEFKERYSDLEDEINALLFEYRGFSNHWTDISSGNTFKSNLPIIELKVFSGVKQILYLKDSSGSVYNLARAMQLEVKKCLDEMKDKNIAAFEIKNIKEVASDVQKGTKEILDMVEEIERVGKKK